MKLTAGQIEWMIGTIEDTYGDDAMSLAERGLFDGTCPGVCAECDSTYDYEPDQDEGWCGECGGNTVVSLLVLMGII